MRKDKLRAIALRKRGYSYNIIGRKLSVPKSTLSAWFSPLAWSNVIKRDLTRRSFERVYPQLRAMARARAAVWAEWRAEARKEAKREFKELAGDPLFIAGVMLYWGEGDKNPVYPVRISNTDPRLLRLFVKFLKKRCGLPKEKMKASLILYPDLNEQVSKKYWSSTTTVPEESFTQGQA